MRDIILFEKLEKLTYSELIIEKMKELILDRKLGPGDRLPSERELALEFGVSRASIREAIKALTALGLLETRTGDGTYVRPNLGESVLEPLSWAVLLAEGVGPDLAETREVIEPSIAGLAAERATASEKKQLLTTLNAMREAVGNPPAFAQADLEFHLALAKAAHNQILLEVMNGLQRLLFGLITSHVIEIEDQKRCLRKHVDVHEAVVAGDAAKAREAMLGSLYKDPLYQTDEVEDIFSRVEDTRD
jgi:GntR family transcriptional repressor for pyruvate dehydrogenase complex